MTFFDYIFYRIAKFYYKRDGLDSYGSIIILSIIQGLLIMEIVTILLRMTYSINEIAKYKVPIPAAKIGMGLGVVLIVLNYFRYKGRYWKLSDRWREVGTPTERTVKGWLVVVAIIVPFIILILLGTGIGKHNL